MAWTPDEIPAQHGRVVVVTGGNAGLGLEVTSQLARNGAHVVIAARNMERAEEAQRTIKSEVPDAEPEIRSLDLASLESVTSCGKGIAATHDRIDLLVNNAGVMAIPEQRTADGFEAQFGINHLGHFVLTRALLPSLLRAPAARVVSVTSFGRLFSLPLDPDNPYLRGKYHPWLAYNQSKLANLHFALELDRRLKASGVPLRSLVAHPGLSATDLQARSVRETGGGLSQRFFSTLARSIGMPPHRAAWCLLRAATDPGADGGEQYAPKWGIVGPPVRRPFLRRPKAVVLRRLWEVSERETGEPFDVAGIVGYGT